MTPHPWPMRLAFQASKRSLSIAYDDGLEVQIPFELLRVESPSAEVQGHAPHQKTLVHGKQAVQVLEADRVGQYAVRLKFDDGHNSGIYSWAYLRELGENADEMMAEYIGRLTQAQLAR